MTSPLSPEAVAQMVADREAGTPGPWYKSETWRPPIGNGPHHTNASGNVFWGYSISGSDENGGHIYPTLAAVHNFPDNIHANARRIARLPDLEAAYLTLAAYNTRLLDENIEFQNDKATLAAENATLRADSDKFYGEAVVAYDKQVIAEAKLATLRASEAAAMDRITELEALIADPIAVHANMLRGTIAMPSFANIKHLYAADFAALTPTADKEPTT